MRNRTEQVTNTFEDGSDEEELADSGDDWQPDEDEKPKKRKSAGSSGGKPKNGAKRGPRAAKKLKKEESEEEESEEEIDEDESEEEVRTVSMGGGRVEKHRGTPDTVSQTLGKVENIRPAKLRRHVAVLSALVLVRGNLTSASYVTGVFIFFLSFVRPPRFTSPTMTIRTILINSNTGRAIVSTFISERGP